MTCRPPRGDDRGNPCSGGYVIIGDTGSALLYSQQLLRNGVTVPVHLIIEGVDRTNERDIESTCYIMSKLGSHLPFLNCEKLRYVEAGDHPCQNDPCPTRKTETITYYTGNGIAGDIIASYYMPRIGPWLTPDNASRATSFWRNNTDRRIYGEEIESVGNTMATCLDISTGINKFSSCCPIVKLDEHLMVQSDGQCCSRNIFQDAYEDITTYDNFFLHTEVKGLTITVGTTGSCYNVTSCNGLDLIENARVIWKTNPYTYLRLAGNAGLDPAPVRVPVTYRAVIPIKKFNEPPGIDLTQAEPGGDLLTSHLSFSMYDNRAVDSSSVTWYGSAYTSDEDLSSVCKEGKYSDCDYTLLIVEVVNVKNRRRASYNYSEQLVDIYYNDNNIEDKWMKKFMDIVACSYNAYTGVQIDPTELIEMKTITLGGLSIDTIRITDVSLRESPVITVLETTAHTYGQKLYPHISGSAC